ncbi:MAG TPA: trypsin-like serine protease [Thermomicrobiales bacterium]|nr:trypsin-like serine protease [Thermomicrobiales bacterium]
MLDQAITLDECGKLPEVGVLDSLANKKGKQDRIILASGYGLTYSSPVGVVSFCERLMAYGQAVNLNSANNGNGKGGACSGDSGGPIFYPADSNTIVAVTSFGMNSWRRGVDFTFRVDTQEVQDWIARASATSQRQLV